MCLEKKGSPRSSPPSLSLSCCFPPQIEESNRRRLTFWTCRSQNPGPGYFLPAGTPSADGKLARFAAYQTEWRAIGDNIILCCIRSSIFFCLPQIIIIIIIMIMITIIIITIIFFVSVEKARRVQEIKSLNSGWCWRSDEPNLNLLLGFGSLGWKLSLAKLRYKKKER